MQAGAGASAVSAPGPADAAAVVPFAPRTGGMAVKLTALVPGQGKGHCSVKPACTCWANACIRFRASMCLLTSRPEGEVAHSMRKS